MSDSAFDDVNDLNQLLSIMREFKPLDVKDDEFVWWRDDKGFSVRTSYTTLEEDILENKAEDDALLNMLNILRRLKLLANSLFLGGGSFLTNFQQNPN